MRTVEVFYLANGQKHSATVGAEAAGSLGIKAGATVSRERLMRLFVIQLNDAGKHLRERRPTVNYVLEPSSKQNKRRSLRPSN